MALIRDIKRINAERAITFSAETENDAKRTSRAASRVPIPETETGISVISPAMVAEIDKYRNGILIFNPLAKKYI